MYKLWDDKLTELLIDVIHQNEEIWNYNHPLYTNNKRLRHITWTRVIKTFNKAHQGKKKFPPQYIMQRWNNLRKRFEDYKRHSDGGNPPTWQYYDRLSFLLGHPTRKRSKVCKAESGQSSPRLCAKVKTETDEDGDISIGSITPVKFYYENDGKCDDYSTESRKTDRSSWEVQMSFGNYIATELMHLDEDLQCRAKKAFFDILMDLQCEHEKRRKAPEE